MPLEKIVSVRQTVSAFAADAFGNALATKVVQLASTPPKGGKEFSIDNLDEYDPSATLGQFDENSLGWTASANDPLAMTLSTDIDKNFLLDGGSIDEWNWLQEMQAQAPGQSIGEWDFETGTVSYAADPFTAKGMNSGYALSSPEQLKYISPASGRSAIPSVDYLGIVDDTLMGLGFGNGSGLTTSMTPQDAKLDRLLNMSSGLKIGSSGDAVIALQQELGFTGKALDGKFGGKTNSVLQNRISGLQEYSEIVKLSHDPDVRAFLKTLGHFESGNTYNVINGGKEFFSFADHPRIKVSYETKGVKWTSSAAGAYQFQPGTWDTYASKYGLGDFSPNNQDLAAIGLLKSQGAIAQLKAGNIEGAIYKASKDWDAFPASSSGVSKWGGSRPLEPILKLYEVNLNEKVKK